MAEVYSLNCGACYVYLCLLSLVHFTTMYKYFSD